MNIQTWFDAIWVETERSFKSDDLIPNVLTHLSSVLISLIKQEYRQTMLRIIIMLLNRNILKHSTQLLVNLLSSLFHRPLRASKGSSQLIIHLHFNNLLIRLISYNKVSSMI